MSSPTDFNLSPYYDDFAESKSFHRILFRPAFAVQARELTQSQTILQNQVEKLGDHFFKNGAMIIPGEIGYDLNYYAVKLSSIDSANTLAHFTNGTVLTGSVSGVTATIVNQSATDGTDPDTLFVKYSATGGSLNNEFKFSDGETINGTNSDSTIVNAVVDTTATGSAAQVEAGSYYINGFTVTVNKQTILLDKYSNTPSYRVGLLVTESFVTPTQDTTLNDNAQGVSNTNAPGAHRFKIDLTLIKKAIGATDDSNFVELLRLKTGIIQSKVRNTEYAILEQTFARRTYDESGDYTVRPFDIDIREHLISANNRGIYTEATGGDATKLAVGMSPGKAYVKGYEVEKLATQYIDIDKAREFNTESNFNTRFDVGNYVNVTNVYGTPDIGFVSGETEAFKRVNLYNTATSVRGTENAGSAASLSTIGRAKTKGFEYAIGTNAGTNIWDVNSTFKHFLFDINLFTHLNITTGQAFTTGEKITGGTSGATGTLESISTQSSESTTTISVASPGVVSFAAPHNFKEGQVITFDAISAQDQTVAIQTTTKFVVRNVLSGSFELYKEDGVTPTNINQYTSSANVVHGVVVVSNVQGTFIAGETITGGTSSNTATIQDNKLGFKGVTSYDFPQVKQIGMAGSPTYTADTALDNTYGVNTNISGTIDVGSTSKDVTGINTFFTEELVVGDSISFPNDNGDVETQIVKLINSNSSLTLEDNTVAASTKTIVTRRRSKIQSPEKNVSVFQLPYETIKTLKTTINSGITDTNFKVRRHFVQTLSSNGDATITAGTNETFAALLDKDFSISIMSTGSGGSGAAGDVFSLQGNNHEGDPVFTLSGSPTGKTLLVDMGANFQGHKVKILATINRSVAGSKTKTLNTASTIQKTDQTEIESGTIGLGKADVLKINNVYMAADFTTDAITSDTNITDRFDLDSGMRDNFYDIGRLTLKTGSITPTGRLLVDFDYFSHGTGDYFDVDSYSGILDYEQIPSFTSGTTGQVYELRDSLDFRPRVDDASTINSGDQDRSYDGSGASTNDIVKFETDITSDFEFYLQRVDKIFLDKEGSFRVLKGASSLTPEIPSILDNAMHLYTLFIPSYTLDTADVGIQTVDNRRYTMRDIGRLEKRIENTEYYTQLSLLEQSAQLLQIQDANGFERFKNGFVVDNFTGHGIGDPGNVDYKVAMDMAKGEMRPTFNEDAVALEERASDGTVVEASDRTDANYQKTGDLITLPYTEETLIDQSYASKTVNVNPFGIFTWIGSVALTPQTDEWKETERAPDLHITNDDGTWDTLVKQSGNPNLQSVELGTVWNEWQNHWTGQSTTNSTEQFEQRGGHGWRVMQRDVQTTTRTGTKTRTGIRQVLVPKTVTQNVGDRVISIAFTPFIRSRDVDFVATRLKPNTRVYPYFDNESISTYVTPLGGALGGNLVTDNNGSVSGTFSIPDPKDNTKPRWRTGERIFRLTSSSSNDLTSAPDTAANAEYIARGIIQTVQNTIISTRTAGVEFRATNETEAVTENITTRGAARQVGYHDPLAQTFMIDDAGGVFLTSVDICFSTKDDNIPVTLQVRNTVNGYPGQSILPFSEKSLNPASITTSTDGTAVTTFTFESPVYVQENTEYSLVLMANTTEYNVFVARLGQTNLGSNRTISQQPYTGVFFKSQNGVTWSADQNEDLKFKIKRAEFKPVIGQVTLTNKDLDSRTLKLNPLRTTSASGVIRVYHPNHGMHGTSNNVTISGVPSGTHNGIVHSDINGTYTSISNVTLDSYDITTAGTANTTGDIGGDAVTATQNRSYDVLNLGGIQTMTLPETSLNMSIRPTSGKSIHGSESEFALTANINKINVVSNDNIFFTAPQLVASPLNETNEMSGSKSFFNIVTLSSTNTKVSPVLDTQRMSAFTITNRLNNPTSGNTPDFVADTTSTGSSTAAVYCTKSIVLETASTSLDVRLTSNVRSTSKVKMYYRIIGSEDDTTIDKVGWTPFNTDGEEDITVTPAENNTSFKEYKYSVNGLKDFTTFQLKIGMTGSTSSYPPIIRDMRAIALAV